MITHQPANPICRSAIAVILGGGRGTRLWPLTKYRAKPAVPIAGKYRLIDIPISNCLNSGLDRIYVLTQFNSSSLNRHITRTYQLDPFSRGFVILEAANQSDENMDWYQGTSDAVRRNLKNIMQWRPEYILILPGDTIFRMDLSRMLQFHVDRGAEVTIALHATEPARASGFGITTLGTDDRILAMNEKPAPEKLPPLAAGPEIRAKWGMDDAHPYLASMGVYVFNTETLREMLESSSMLDFGHQILPLAVRSRKVYGHVFTEFWEDIGTIRSYYETTLALLRPDPPFAFYDAESPIYTRMRFLPATRIDGGNFTRARVAEGSHIKGADLENCLVGIRAIIGRDVRMRDTIMMGADYFSGGALQPSYEPVPDGAPEVGVGDGCVIERAIIDKNARVGKGCKITNHANLDHHDDPAERYYIRDGIVIVPKHGILEPGTEI